MCGLIEKTTPGQRAFFSRRPVSPSFGSCLIGKRTCDVNKSSPCGKRPLTLWMPWGFKLSRKVREYSHINFESMSKETRPSSERKIRISLEIETLFHEVECR